MASKVAKTVSSWSREKALHSAVLFRFMSARVLSITPGIHSRTVSSVDSSAGRSLATNSMQD